METIWERVRAGENLALLGPLRGPVPTDLRLLRVRCGGGGLPLRPLLEAQELVGPPEHLLDLAAERMRAGLRRRLLGEELPLDRGGHPGGFPQPGRSGDGALAGAGGTGRRRNGSLAGAGAGPAGLVAAPAAAFF